MRGKVLMSLVAGLGVVSVAAAAGPPPPPKAVNGHPVTVVARGIPTPTTFAFGGGQVFVAGYGDEQNPKITGGVYVLKGGKAVKCPARRRTSSASPGATERCTSAGAREWRDLRLERLERDPVHEIPRRGRRPRKGFTVFNGIAVGPDGKLYAGISMGDAKRDDYSKGTTPYANSVVTVDPATGKIAIVATGMRQPWQPVFVPGHSGPLIADLGQENLGKKHPVDRIVEIKQGADFGFPSCPAKPATCTKYDKPFAVVPGALLADGPGRSWAASSTSRCSAAPARGRKSSRCRSPGGKYTPSRRVRRPGGRTRHPRRKDLRRRPDRTVYSFTP